MICAWENPHCPPVELSDEFATPLAAPPPVGVDFLEILKSTLPVVRRIPPFCSGVVSRTLALLIDNLMRRKSWGSLFRLLPFPRVALRSPKSGGRNHRLARRELINSGCVACLRDPIHHLLSQSAMTEQ